MEPQEQGDPWKGRSEEELQREVEKGIEELAQAPGPEQHLQEKNDESERKKVEGQLPKLGEAMDEKMKIGGIELTPASTIKQLRHACEFLKVGKTGSKAQIWQRLKEAVASNKMKELVEISQGLEIEFSREPDGEKRPEAPSEEERKRHELTHLPKADWCESCSATRSREDDFKTTEKKYEASGHVFTHGCFLFEKEHRTLLLSVQPGLGVNGCIIPPHPSFVSASPKFRAQGFWLACFFRVLPCLSHQAIIGIKAYAALHLCILQEMSFFSLAFAIVICAWLQVPIGRASSHVRAFARSRHGPFLNRAGTSGYCLCLLRCLYFLHWGTIARRLSVLPAASSQGVAYLSLVL